MSSRSRTTAPPGSDSDGFAQSFTKSLWSLRAERHAALPCRRGQRRLHVRHLHTVEQPGYVTQVDPTDELRRLLGEWMEWAVAEAQHARLCVVRFVAVLGQTLPDPVDGGRRIGDIATLGTRAERG